MARQVPLILGGHSFISQLGNDPPVTEQDQHRIVEACLDCGIGWFDSTYQPERRALGNALHALGRRDEATILAWNFFTDFSPGDRVPEPEYYRPEHIDIMLEQLRTDWIDCLVVLPFHDRKENRRQDELVMEWHGKGYVRSLGRWVPDRATVKRYRGDKRFRFAIRPFNITTDDAAPIFGACKMHGWETLATSPFVRGWELDRMVAAASAGGDGDDETLRPMLADLMLRFSLFQRDVDRVIVAMRKVEWVVRNVESVARGPLTAEELGRLRRLRGYTAHTRRWWRWWQRLAGRP